MSRHNKMKLMSSDREVFEVDELVVYASEFLKTMLEVTMPAVEAIPLFGVPRRILSKVIEYCKYHVESQMTSDEELPVPEDVVEEWDAEFVKVDRSTLCGLVNAAHYSNIEGLLDLTCQTVADMIKNKSPKEFRDFLYIKNDFTHEEDEEATIESEWVFT